MSIYGYGGTEITSAAAGYRDIISVVNGGTGPDVLRLNFSVDGDLSVSIPRVGPIGGGGFAHVDVLNYVNSPYEFESLGSPGVEGSPLAARFTAGYDAGGTYYSSLTSSGWDSQGGGAYTYHIDVPYDELIGGYRFATILVTTAWADGPPAFGSEQAVFSDFGHTLKFTGLSLTDATPLNTADFHFDSGLSFDASPVPEPSSFALLGLGGIGLACSAHRRRKTVITV